tara:strand:+ start:4284 stop:4508 length:225 start_codon:yes stop_codon:yes gene_type:complete
MDWIIILNNFIYASVGSVLTLGFMIVGYKLFDLLHPLDLDAELGKDNRAVGMVVAAIFIGLGIAVGLVIGLGLN